MTSKEAREYVSSHREKAAKKSKKPPAKYTKNSSGIFCGFCIVLAALGGWLLRDPNYSVWGFLVITLGMLSNYSNTFPWD